MLARRSVSGGLDAGESKRPRTGCASLDHAAASIAATTSSVGPSSGLHPVPQTVTTATTRSRQVTGTASTSRSSAAFGSDFASAESVVRRLRVSEAAADP